LATSTKNPPAVKQLPYHPVAKKFGYLTGAEFDALVNDIKTNKQKVPIVTYKGTIIDGIQRYRACLSAKVEPVFTEYVGEEKDIIKFIASMNLLRRHLSTKQKKEAALELLKADPTVSDLAVAKTTRLSDKTVTKIRTGAVRRSEIPNVKIRTDSKGRQQPAAKPNKAAPKLHPPCGQPSGSPPKATRAEVKGKNALWDLEDAWSRADREVRREFISQIGLVELYAQAPTAQKEKLAAMIKNMEPVS
jgi:ParB-like chromosome segregation protein Spo0J